MNANANEMKAKGFCRSFSVCLSLSTLISRRRPTCTCVDQGCVASTELRPGLDDNVAMPTALLPASIRRVASWVAAQRIGDRHAALAKVRGREVPLIAERSPGVPVAVEPQHTARVSGRVHKRATAAAAVVVSPVPAPHRNPWVSTLAAPQYHPSTTLAPP